MRKDKNCPLCNGKEFKVGDDPGDLCVDCMCKTIGLLLVGIIKGGRSDGGDKGRV